jgi:tetratricopeptide (TPR) repeat protein
MTDFERSEKIEKYVLGQLEGAELTAFEAQLKKDKALAEEVAIERDIAGALSEPDVLSFRQTLQGVRQDYHRKGNGRRGFTIIWRTLVVAASVVLLVAAGHWLFQRQAGPLPAADALFDSHFAPPGALVQGSSERDGSASGGGLSSEMAAWTAVDELYKSGDYAAALNRLKSFPTSLTDSFPSKYHYQYGLLELILGRPAEAILHFEKIEMEYADEKNWYKALALLKLEGKTAGVKTAFEKAASSQNPWQQQAMEVLEKLDF